MSTGEPGKRRENIVPILYLACFTTLQRLIRCDERRDAQFTASKIALGLLTSLGFFWANWVNFPLVHILVAALIIRAAYI